MERAVRLKSHIRVAAILRRAGAAGVQAVVARRGDEDAGAIALKIYLGRVDGAPLARLLVETQTENGHAAFRDAFDGPQAEDRVDERLAREAKIDRDLWIVEIEDREGRSFTD